MRIKDIGRYIKALPWLAEAFAIMLFGTIRQNRIFFWLNEVLGASGE